MIWKNKDSYCLFNLRQRIASQKPANAQLICDITTGGNEVEFDMAFN